MHKLESQIRDSERCKNITRFNLFLIETSYQTQSEYH